MASIRDELAEVQASDYWEIVDRGTNFDYLPFERKRHLPQFFAWFDGLPTPRSSASSQAPAAPGRTLLGSDPRQDRD
jgi:hypothetical protein